MLRTSLIVLALVAFISCAPEKKKSGSVKVGAASAPVNPPSGAFIAGDKQNRRFTAVHDSLFAKAVVVSDGQTSLAIVTIDCIGLLYPDVQRIRKLATAKSGVPAEHIIVSSTHTHSGPDVVGIWGTDYQHSGVDTVYMSFLVRTAAEQVIRASREMKDVQVITSETTFDGEWVQNICDEELDRSVSIMKFTTDDGTSVATLTNFACHPTFMDAKFTEVSSDYVGGFYKEMNSRLGGENLFLQGPIGGWVQPVDGEGTFEKAERRGRELATTVLTAVAKGNTQSDGAIQFNSKQVNLPVANEGWKQLSAIGTINRSIQDSVQTEMAWFAIGNAQFATHPGETTPYLGLETKKLMKTGPKFVLGLSNDALGYILKPIYFSDSTKPHAEYLTSMSVGPETSPRVLKTMQAIIK